jgi:hypothetical protein
MPTTLAHLELYSVEISCQAVDFGPLKLLSLLRVFRCGFSSGFFSPMVTGLLQSLLKGLSTFHFHSPRPKLRMDNAVALESSDLALLPLSLVDLVIPTKVGEQKIKQFLPHITHFRTIII